jgi:hypothetical protein
MHVTLFLLEVEVQISHSWILSKKFKSDFIFPLSNGQPTRKENGMKEEYLVWRSSLGEPLK